MPTDAERRDLQADLQKLRAYPGYSTAEQVEELMAAVGSLLPHKNQSDAESAMAAELFIRAVNDIPYDQLEAAFQMAVKELQWFPTPKHIRDFAKKAVVPRFNRIWMIERLLEQRHETDDHGPMADPAEVKALVAKATAA